MFESSLLVNMPARFVGVPEPGFDGSLAAKWVTLLP